MHTHRAGAHPPRLTCAPSPPPRSKSDCCRKKCGRKRDNSALSRRAAAEIRRATATLKKESLQKIVKNGKQRPLARGLDRLLRIGCGRKRDNSALSRRAA